MKTVRHGPPPTWGGTGLSRIACCLLVLVPAIAVAQPAGSGGTTLRLSDAERAAVLNRNTEATVDRARAGPGQAAAPDRRPHGEVGIAAGTHAFRSIYGATAIPLGDRGQVAASFESSRFGDRR